jgi:hypothetical protein
MTEQTKDRLIDLGGAILINIIAFVYTKYFILPETGMYVKIDGVWTTSKYVFPYTSELSFSEWPLPFQQGFLAFMFGTFLGFLILIPILRLILDLIVDGVKRLF